MTDLATFLRARYTAARDTAANRRRILVPNPFDCHQVEWVRGSEENESLLIDGHPFPIDEYTTRATEPAPDLNALADLDAKLALLEDLTAERHEVVDGGCWYTCAAATEQQDGGETCDESRQGGPCDCGRDARVNRRLRLLARPFADHPDYQENWAA